MDYAPLTPEPVVSSVNCSNLTVAGSFYTLTENASISGATCFNILAENITLDCDSHWIIGNNAPGTNGVYSSSFNTLLKNCIISNFSVAINLTGATSGLFTNNTLISSSNMLIYINGNASGNTFYWNNFTDTSGAYVNDTNGSNFYNSTLSGQNEGNIWHNVINGSVDITSTNASVGFPSLYVGTAGTGYPYNNSTSLGKVFGNVADAAPLTPQGVTSLICSNLTVAGTTYNLTTNASINGATCFNVTAQNVTLDCAGYSISGNNTTNTYGVYSNQFNTTVKNCVIRSFDVGIFYNKSSNGTLQNDTMFQYIRVGAFYSPGILLYDNSENNTVNLCNVTAYGPGIAVRSSNFNTIANTTVNSSTGGVNNAHSLYVLQSSGTVARNFTGKSLNGGITIAASNNTVVVNSSSSSNFADAIPSTAYPLYITGGNNNSVINSSGFSAQGSNWYGLYLSQGASNVTVAGSHFFANNTYAIYLNGVNGSTVANSTFASNDSYAAYLSGASSHAFINNTFLPNSLANNTLVALAQSSGGNTFYWNNFTNTSGAYVNDTNGSNFYNSSLSGQNEGNIWHNVINGSVGITGTAASGFGSGLYIGDSGAGYPYNNSTSQSKIFGNVVDWAPLTPTQTPAALNCSNLSVAGTTYNLTANASISGATCFNVTAQNVTLDCSGFSITGTNASNTYGFWTNQYNSTIKNCYIANFAEAIRYQGATDGLMLNNTANITFSGGSGIRITSNAHRNNATQNALYGTISNGAYIDGGANTTLDCAGRNVQGASVSGRYGIYTDQFGTRISGCNISIFAPGVYFNGADNGTINNTNVSMDDGTYAAITLSASADYNVIQNSRATNPNVLGYGVYAASSTRNTILSSYGSGGAGGIVLESSTLNSIISSNASSDAYAIYLTGASGTNVTGSYGESANTALALDNSASNNTITGSTFNASSTAIIIGGGSGNRVINSTANSNASHGISLTGAVNNEIINSTARNIVSGTGYGISISSNSHRNNITRTVASSALASAIYIDGGQNVSVDCQGISLAGANQTGTYGIFSSQYNTSVKNCTVSNFTYGVYLNGSTSLLSYNNITNNTVAGLLLGTGASAASLLSNRICSNTFDLNNSGSGNTGALSACDSFLNWAEEGHLGCAFSCTSLWHRVFANITTGTLFLGKNQTSPYAYSWDATKGLNVYVANYNASINWQSLQAIGRNTTNGTADSDFFDLDIAFASQNYSDNITSTYSSDGTTPLLTQNFTIFQVTIPDVPVAASTPYNTTFKTGILWDTSAGGTEYNYTNRQPTVWTVAINQTAEAEAFGEYDYLAQYPATLGTYGGTGDLVSIYLELK